MFKEFLNQHSNIPESKTLRIDERIKLMIKTFDGLVDFLRDPNKFPNKEINDATTLMWRLIGNKNIPMVLDQWRFPSLVFMVIGDQTKTQRSPLFVMPVNFVDQVKENAIMQLGVVAYMASQARDYYSGALTDKNSETVNRRARAFEAETLLTIAKMASSEGSTAKLNEWQKNILKEFPEGLKSLPQELNYKTPEYMQQNFRNN
jgi:hypothetical protein